MKKRLIYLLLIVTMMAQFVFPISTSAAELVYTNDDIKPYVNSLRKLNAFTLYDGDSFFENDKAVTRYEAAKAIVDIVGYADHQTVGNVGSLFFDVPDYYEYAGDISLAVNLGFMNGVGNGLFEPEKEILKLHFLKSLIIAAGYEWEVEARGGYPQGYTTVAERIGLLEHFQGDLNDVMTREEMVKVLYHFLDVRVGEVISINGGKDTTILNHYYGIWKEKGVVYTNQTTSLRSNLKPIKNQVLIDNEYLQVVNCEEVYNYLGYEVEYFYRDNGISAKKDLMIVTPTTDNILTMVEWRDIKQPSSTSCIAVYDSDGRVKKNNIDRNASFLYNGEIITSGIPALIDNLSGHILLLDYDDDDDADLVQINEYTYDIVSAVDAQKEKIYCENTVIDLSLDGVTIQSKDGFAVTLANIQKEAAVAIAKSRSGNRMSVVVLPGRSVVTISSVNVNGITTTEGDEYLYDKNFTDTEKIKPGATLELALNLNGEIIFAFDSISGKIGYLVKAGSTKNTFGEVETLVLKVLNDLGDIVQFSVPEKVKLDGVEVKRGDLISSLANIKTNLDLSSDGTVSQVILYSLNTNNEIVEIHTAAGTNGLVMGYNSNVNGPIQIFDSDGYSVATFGSSSITRTHAISNKAVIFKVPEVNQENESEKYFGIVTFNKGVLISGDKLETYLSDTNSIEPFVAVYYPGTLSTNGFTGTKEPFYLIQSVEKTLNADGEVCTKLDGFEAGVRKQYEVSPSATIPSDLEAGDVVTFLVDNAGIAQACRKVYDIGTNTLDEKLGTPEIDNQLGDDIKSPGGGVRLYHVYRAPSDTTFIEAYRIGFEDGIPGDEYKMMVPTKPHRSTKQGPMYFDKETKTAQGTPPSRIVDYQLDPENYTMMLVRYISGYTSDIILFN